MLNWFSSACIVQGRQAGSLYVNITMFMIENNRNKFDVRFLTLMH